MWCHIVLLLEIIFEDSTLNLGHGERIGDSFHFYEALLTIGDYLCCLIRGIENPGETLNELSDHEIIGYLLVESCKLKEWWLTPY